MTVKQAYEATLIELDKQSAPAVTLESFNYLINSIMQVLTLISRELMTLEY